MWGHCLCVLQLFLYALRSVFILKWLLYYWKRLDSRKNALISLSAMLEFPNTWLTPQNPVLKVSQRTLWVLKTGCDAYELIHQRVMSSSPKWGMGGCCHGSLIFSCRPFPHFFSASHAAVISMAGQTHTRGHVTFACLYKTSIFIS